MKIIAPKIDSFSCFFCFLGDFFRLLQVAEVEKHNYKIMTRIGLTYKKLGDLVNAEKYLNQAVRVKHLLELSIIKLI